MDLDLDLNFEKEKVNPFDTQGQTYSFCVTEMALVGDKGYVASKAGISLEDMNKLSEMPHFIKDVNSIRDEYKKDGLTPFEAKSRIFAHMGLDEVASTMLNKNEKAVDRLAAAKLLMQAGGFLDKSENNQGVAVSFNFGSVNPAIEQNDAFEKMKEEMEKAGKKIE